MIPKVSSVYKANNQPKGFNSYYKRETVKISTLPSDMTVGKSKKKSWTELLSPWIIVFIIILAVGLLDGLIGG